MKFTNNQQAILKTTATKASSSKFKEQKIPAKVNLQIGVAFEIQQAIKRVLNQLNLDIDLQNIHLEHPALEDHGDYSSNIAMVLFNQLKSDKKRRSHQSGQIKDSKNLADYIVGLLTQDQILLKAVSKIETAGHGFVNFWLKKEYLISETQKIIKSGKGYGKSKIYQGRKAIVEYSSPNIAKPFTVGHLRSTIIGDAVANLLETIGYQVYRDNHLGDWGTQFGKQIYAIKQWGDIEKIEKSVNPVKDLVDLYVKFHQQADKDPLLNDNGREWFKKLEDGDPEARSLWQKCVDWSWKEFDKIYQVLNVKFTENNGRGYGESFFEDKMQSVVDELKEAKLLKKSQGAQIVEYPNGEYPPLMILKQDGATLYSTRDLATDKFRFQKHGNNVLIINEVGNEQNLYFRQLIKIEELLNWIKPGQRVHIGHGHYRFKDKKMSTRKGEVIWLEEVLSMAIAKAQKVADQENININNPNKRPKSNKPNRFNDRHQEIKTATLVAVGALKYNDLKRVPNLDIIFDWDEILNMQGNSGPYLQYTHARCQSVLEKFEIRNPKSEINSKQLKTFKNSKLNIVSNFDIRYSNLNPEELSLLRHLYRFPETVLHATKEYAPNHICTYLYNLAQDYNTFYGRHSILNSETEKLRNFRLLLTAATAQILQNGLNLLGIEAPEKM